MTQKTMFSQSSLLDSYGRRDVRFPRFAYGAGLSIEVDHYNQGVDVEEEVRKIVLAVTKIIHTKHMPLPF